MTDAPEMCIVLSPAFCYNLTFYSIPLDKWLASVWSCLDPRQRSGNGKERKAMHQIRFF